MSVYVCLSLCLSVCLSGSNYELKVCVCLCVYVCLSACLSVYVCLCLSGSNYELKENAKIAALLNNFDDFISEESLWQISETIKPRPSSKHLSR